MKKEERGGKKGSYSWEEDTCSPPVFLKSLITRLLWHSLVVVLAFFARLVKTKV
jgi:hypothetical protein